MKTKNKKTSPKVEHAALVHEALALLNALIFVNAAEVKARTDKIKKLPTEGLLKLLEVLKKAHQKQHEYFQVLTERDFMFPAQINVMAYKGKLQNLANKKS